MIKLSDIAELANVSKSAASLALNGKPGISEETRERILKVANENNYQPLRKRSKPVEPERMIRFVASTNGDIIPENYDQLPFFKELLSNLYAEANKESFKFLTNTFPKNSLIECLKMIEEQEPSDGILLLGTNLSEKQIETLSQHFPHLVVLDTQCFSVNCNTITMNNRQGAYAAANFLLTNGHRKIGYIKGRPRISNFEGRRTGFKEALRSNEINPDKLPKYYLPAMEIETITHHLDQFEAFINDVTAVFCENDYIAISAIKTLTALGYNIPADLSVIGFDDIAESRVISPELTTIQVPIKQIANEAIQLIKTKNFQDGVKKQIFLNTELVVRESVKNLKKG